MAFNKDLQTDKATVQLVSNLVIFRSYYLVYTLYRPVHTLVQFSPFHARERVDEYS
jgi:hypothetical protein